MQEISFLNIQLISQNANHRLESFGFTEIKRKGEKPDYLIKKNLFIEELFLRMKHVFLKNAKENYKNRLSELLDKNIQILKKEWLQNPVNPKRLDFFYVMQRFHHLQYQARPIFQSLSLKNTFELSETKIRINEITQKKLENISENQKPYIKEKGFLKWKKKNYYYSEDDAKINHGKEAFRIFINTQKERLLSLIGKIVSFKKNFFQSKQYFRNHEDKNDGIYAKDKPTSEGKEATSYWIGHATCFFNLSFKTKENETIHLNIITDPVEGDLNKIFYPRMTRPAKKIEDCPFPHILLLSHNHLDHFDKKTLQKLQKDQPVVLVPKGDAKKFYDLGFKHVYEHEWWQKTTIPIEQNGKQIEVKITAVPTRHWSGQGMFDAHTSLFLGFVIEKEEGDIYFAGDTARLSEGHIETLRNRFNIRSMFQPGGPDEVRKDMESTHQASVDAFWMHFRLSVQNLYDRHLFKDREKQEFIKQAKELRTLFMHTKAYKLGNLHFDDTDKSVAKIKEALKTEQINDDMKSYEVQVYQDLLNIGKNLTFSDDSCLTALDILQILETGVILPKIGERTKLAKELTLQSSQFHQKKKRKTFHHNIV